MKIKHFYFNKLIKEEEGFTLVEVLVSMVILSVGILGSLSLMTSILNNSQLLENQGIAQHIMQEGLEVAANIRNQNFLDRSNEASDTDSTSRREYNEGLEDGNYCINYMVKDGDNIVGYTSGSFDNVVSRELDRQTGTNTGCDICIGKDSNGKYNELYTEFDSEKPCVGVKFTRKINIQEKNPSDNSNYAGSGDINSSYLNITSTVEWDDGGERKIEGILRLYDYSCIEDEDPGC